MSRPRDRSWNARALGGFVGALVAFYAIYAANPSLAYLAGGAALAVMIALLIAAVAREI